MQWLANDLRGTRGKTNPAIALAEIGKSPKNTTNNSLGDSSTLASRPSPVAFSRQARLRWQFFRGICFGSTEIHTNSRTVKKDRYGAKKFPNTCIFSLLFNCHAWLQFSSAGALVYQIMVLWVRAPCRLPYPACPFRSVARVARPAHLTCYFHHIPIISQSQFVHHILDGELADTDYMI